MDRPGISKKQAVLTRLYHSCKAGGSLVFHNDAVKRAAAAVDCKNPFDATKIDRSALLPQALDADD